MCEYESNICFVLQSLLFSESDTTDTASMLTVTSHGHKSVRSKTHCATITYILDLASNAIFLFPVDLAWIRVPAKIKGKKKKTLMAEESREKVRMLLPVLRPLAECVAVRGSYSEGSAQ